MDLEIAEVMEEPFPAVSVDRLGARGGGAAPGDRQALTVTEHGRPRGIVTRADLLESLVT